MDEQMRIESVKKDGSLKIMDITMKGLRKKKEELEGKKQKVIEMTWMENKMEDWAKWREQFEQQQRYFENEAKARKDRKMRKLIEEDVGKGITSIRREGQHLQQQKVFLRRMRRRELAEARK